MSNILPDFPGQHFPGDMRYLVELTSFKDIIGDQWIQYCVRGK